MTPRLPRLARFLAGLTVPREDRDFLLGDLDEAFAQLARVRSPGAARRWYWWQVLRGVAGVRPRLREDTLAGLRGDLRVALRSLVRRPAYAVGSVGTLLLGLSSAAAVGVVAWRVWLAPLPFPDPERLVRVFELEPSETGASSATPGAGADGWDRLHLSPPLLEDLRREEWRTVEGVAGLGQATLEWTSEEGTVQIQGIRATPGLLRVLGVVPLAGRGLAEDPSEPEVVLSEALWVRAFGTDPAAVGRTLTLDGEPHRIVGVVSFPRVYPRDAQLLTHLTFSEQQRSDEFRGARYLEAVARVRPGRTVEEASAEMAAFVGSLGPRLPIHEGHAAAAIPLGRDLAAPYRGVLTLLLVAGAAFLLLALVNVAGMVATRRAQEGVERGVRNALGATRRRLLAGELVETLLLGGLAGVGAVAATQLILGPMVALPPPETPRLDQVRVGVGAAALLLASGLAVGGGVGLLAHLLAPLAPAVGRAPGGSRGTGGRRLLVAGQVALTTLLATGGVTVLRHVSALQAVELGFEPEGVSTRFVAFHPARYPGDGALHAAWDRVLEGVTARGAEAVVAANPPLTGSNFRYGYRVPEAPEGYHYAQYHAVTPGYFDLLGIDLLEGRGIQETDLGDGEPVVVVNQEVARSHFPAGEAVGRSIDLVGTRRRIVGVVASTRHFGPDRDPPGEVYIPLSQDSEPGFGMLLARSPREDLPALLQEVLDGVDPTLAPTPTLPFTHYVRDWFASLRLQLTVVLALGAVGLTLAVLGIYALVSYEVSLRRRETGIRKALGAPPAGLFRGVVRQGALPVVGGALVGVAAWYLALPAAARFVAGAGEGGGWVPAAVAAGIGVAAVAATLLPAWRSTSVDVVQTLRGE